MKAAPQFADWLSRTNDVTSRFIGAARIPGLINVAGGLPDPSLFPVDALADIAARAIREHPQDTLAYGPTAGNPELREALAAKFRARGVNVTAENVLVTASGSQALDLVGKALIDPGAPVACVFPTYLGALDSWRPRDPSYRHIDLADPAATRTALDGARYAYLIPNFSNPTGHLVDLEGRETLLAAATATGTPIVEDDPYGALYFDGPRLPTLLELSARGTDGPYEGPVIHLGSMSKQLCPGLRVGWVVAAKETIKVLSTAKQATDLCSNGLAQMMTLGAFQSGLIDAVHPKAIALYSARRDALCDALKTHLAAEFEWERPVGGMFVWARARDRSLDLDALVERGVEQGVLVGPGHVFDPLKVDGPALRLNFTLNDEERLATAMQRLKAAMQATRRKAA
ncbi:PLP-dependent aminotransferase family protein [Acuticoccus yangtzensis]|uniref:aminotransferase-like domain-containing protein n=1 Tax=Acuticoccus yangtzensis TaxID=1443441 RepID=UPI0009497B7B|nr:PLP-dependent aminotransferase family protein [Acuticoccus yangtzensis]